MLDVETRGIVGLKRSLEKTAWTEIYKYGKLQAMATYERSKASRTRPQYSDHALLLPTR